MEKRVTSPNGSRTLSPIQSNFEFSPIRAAPITLPWPLYERAPQRYAGRSARAPLLARAHYFCIAAGAIERWILRTAGDGGADDGRYKKERQKENGRTDRSIGEEKPTFIPLLVHACFAIL